MQLREALDECLLSVADRSAAAGAAVADFRRALLQQCRQEIARYDVAILHQRRSIGASRSNAEAAANQAVRTLINAHLQRYGGRTGSR